MEVVLIVLAVLVLLGIGWALLRKQRFEGRREEAGELRQTARSHEVEAEQHQAQAQRHARQAAEVDPDVEESDTRAR